MPPCIKFRDEFLFDIFWNLSRSPMGKKCRKELAICPDDFRFGIVHYVGYPSGLQYDQVRCCRRPLIAHKVGAGDISDKAIAVCGSSALTG